ncbi:MAG: DNA-methyltransferase [Candidatus Hodarchaeota archaeon]
MNLNKDERTEHHIYFSNAIQMADIPPSSVHLIVTSPPYWSLKRYGKNKQIGFNQAYEAYLEDLRAVIAEMARLIQKWRFICINVGTAVSDRGMKSIPADIIRIAEKYDFLFRKEIIWKKPKGVQGLWQRGTTQFLKKTPFPTFLNLNILHETILIFQQCPGLVAPSAQEWREHLEGKGVLTSNNKLTEEFIKKWAWSVWELDVSKTKGHPAPFPVELPQNLIRLYSYPGEIVLDPFLGSGTTSQAAILEGRNSIGYEKNMGYRKLIGQVLRITKNPLEQYLSPKAAAERPEDSGEAEVYESGIRPRAGDARALIYFHRSGKERIHQWSRDDL